MLAQDQPASNGTAIMNSPYTTKSITMISLIVQGGSTGSGYLATVQDQRSAFQMLRGQRRFASKGPGIVEETRPEEGFQILRGVQRLVRSAPAIAGEPRRGEDCGMLRGEVAPARPTPANAEKTGHN